MKGAEQVGSVRRWGRDTRGNKALLETLVSCSSSDTGVLDADACCQNITYHYAGYTDAPVMLVDLARALGVALPHGEKLTLVLDWNNALSSINTTQHERPKSGGARWSVL